MTTEKLSEYILHYLKNNKTKTAIMLSGEWGSGKSYYVEHELLPFLKANDYTAVVVSLYGISDIPTISKSIYMELKIPSLNNMKTEKLTTGKIVAKSIIRNLTSVVGVDLNIPEDDLKRIYESVDLKDKLLIFEDVERTKIGIINLLGYVNSLVERDGVKVLLIANENEIMVEDETVINDENENNNSSKELQMYTRVKEKTISDTIQYYGEYKKAIQQIVNEFNNSKLEELFRDNPDLLSKVSRIVNDICKKNLRTFIFAIQKTVDIIDKVECNEYENDFFECIMIGILYFSTKLNVNGFPRWEGNEYLSTKLGSKDTPLMRFAYNYLRWQTFDESLVINTYTAYRDFVFYEINAEYQDEDLRTLSAYYAKTEEEVLTALNNIENKLVDVNSIGIKAYCKLAYNMIKVGKIIGFDYKKSLNQMKENAKKMGGKSYMYNDSIWIDMYEFKDPEAENDFRTFMKEITEFISHKEAKYELSYNPDDISDLYNDVCRNKYKYIKNHVFLSNYNIESILEMLKKSNAQQIQDFRGILFAIYRDSGRGEYDEKDIDAMKELLELLNKQENTELYWDKIQLMQIEYLKDNLEEFMRNML